LPRPCPQCGAENGGCQWVIFNPKYYEERTGYQRNWPYSIFRISHYSKEQYLLSPKKNRRTKIWHNFQMRLPGIKRGSEFIPLEKIFDDPLYEDMHSITLALGDEWFDHIKKDGWPRIVTERAHWVNKGDLRKCQECHMYFEKEKIQVLEYLQGYWAIKFSWLCDSCYSIDVDKVKKWKQKQSLNVTRGNGLRLISSITSK
jgi:hypothetical protein